MKTSTVRRSRLMLPLIAGLALASASAFAETSNKWRIEFDESAQANGSIVFAVMRSGAAPVQVVTDVAGGLSEENIAKLVTESFRTSLNATYEVESDDGEHLLIKKRKDMPDFEVKLVSSTVTGLKIDLQRE